MTQCYVYVIASEDGMHKIGVSNTPERRLRSFQQTAGLAALKLARVWCLRNSDVAYTVERQAHLALSDFRVVGEWFNVSLDTACGAVENAVAGRQVPEEPQPECDRNAFNNAWKPTPFLEYGSVWDGVLKQFGFERTMSEVTDSIRDAAERLGLT